MRIAPVVAVLLAVLGLACGDDGGAPRDGGQCLSFEQAVAEFAPILEENGACTSDSDCTLVFPGCPLGCSFAVSAAGQAAVSAAAATLVERARCGGLGCEFRCTVAGSPACRSKRCVSEALHRDSSAP